MIFLSAIKAAIKLFVSHKQLAKTVEPTVRHLDDPAPCKDFQRRPAGIARVGTQVLASSLWRLGALDHDGIQYGPQLRDVMPVGAGHDER